MPITAPPEAACLFIGPAKPFSLSQQRSSMVLFVPGIMMRAAPSISEGDSANTTSSLGSAFKGSKSVKFDTLGSFTTETFN